MNSSVPSTTDCACRVIISTMQNSSQAKLSPFIVIAFISLSTEQSIVGNDNTVKSTSSWPACEWNLFVKMLSFNYTIFFGEFRHFIFSLIDCNISGFGIFLPKLLESSPELTWKVLLTLSACFLYVLLGKWKSLAKKLANPKSNRNSLYCQSCEKWRNHTA